MVPSAKNGDSPIARFGALAAIALVAWLSIWGYYEAVESTRAQTWWWAERPVRIWTTTAIPLFVPVALGAAASEATRRALALVPATLIPAVVIGLYTAYHEATPLEYDNGLKLVYPVFVNLALGVSAMGMIIPVSLQWRRLLVPGR